MIHQPVVSSDLPNDLARMLRRTSIGYLLLAVTVAGYIRLRGFDGIQDYYFFQQDLPLLIVAGVAMIVLSRRSWTGQVTSAPWHHRHLGAVIAMATGVAYAGSWLVIDRYAQSRDENMADFAGRYMQHGLLGQPIPVTIQPYAHAAMPLSAGQYIKNGYWVSDYLPGNAGIRAVAGLIGDPWLAGPILLAMGLMALWYAARRLWPDRQEAAIVVVVLAVSSTQLIVNAMTPFATTAHFALNALWIACFLRGGRIGHALALGIGLLATGLHQFHFHLLFLSGFVVWMWRSDRKALALLYASAGAIYCVVWDTGYLRLILPALFGTMATDAGTTTTAVPLVDALLAKLQRLLILEPLNGISRFIAWQNILLLPLTYVGAKTIRRRADGSLPISFAFAVSGGIGLLLMPWQGFGYGYRYLHHLLPCFLLLAGAGVVRLREEGRPLARPLLMSSVLVAVLITGPFAAWQSHALLAPYAKAYRLARSAPADVVVVDPLGGAYLQDIVRMDGDVGRPLLLDLDALTVTEILSLCRRRSVMLLDQRQAGALGIIQGAAPAAARRSIDDKRRYLTRPGCAKPVPMG